MRRRLRIRRAIAKCLHQRAIQHWQAAQDRWMGAPPDTLEYRVGMLQEEWAHLLWALADAVRGRKHP